MKGLKKEKEKRRRGQPPLKGCQLTNGDGRKRNPLDGDLLDGRDDRVTRPRLEAVVDDVDGGTDAAEHDREPKQFGDPGTSFSKLFLLSLLPRQEFNARFTPDESALLLICSVTRWLNHEVKARICPSGKVLRL